ncbi:hypothetical protein PO909_017523 [Leuciscus waleckii]
MHEEDAAISSSTHYTNGATKTDSVARLIDMRSLLTLSVLLALIREDKGQKPAVFLLPMFPDVFAGDDVTLICKGRGEPIKWFINGDPQSHQGSSMLLTVVTSKNNGIYECERGGSKSDPYTLTVEELEPHAQLSPFIGGAVMSKGGGRNLVLYVDDDAYGWKCFVLRGESGFVIKPDVLNKTTAVIYAELKEAKRATFWCENGTRRSNAVTLKMTELKVMLDPPAAPALLRESVTLRCEVWGGKAEKATFYKDNKTIPDTDITKDTYIITSATQADTGQYRCHATYRYSHISADAARQEGDSDPQELKVIGGPPAATVESTSQNNLKCFCRNCPDNCTFYYWYHTLPNDPRRRLPENTQIITVEEGGLYSCRRVCGKGFSRFSNVYSYTGGPPAATVESTSPYSLGCFCRNCPDKCTSYYWYYTIPNDPRRRLPENTQIITVKEGGLYSCRMVCGKGFSRFSNVYSYTAQPEPVNVLPIVVAAILMVLGVSIVVLIALKRRRRGGGSVQATAQAKDKTTGGDYEQIQLTDQAVYHTLGAAEGQGQGEGQGEGQGQGEGGYEALKSVKVEMYQTLSSADSKTPAGESKGGYEQLPQKDKDYEAVAVEDNPYEELKAGQQANQ